MANRVDRLTPPIVAEMNRRAGALQDSGVSLVRLVRGEPDFDTPERIRQAAAEALARGETHYPPIPGIPELRAAEVPGGHHVHLTRPEVVAPLVREFLSATV